MFQFYLWDYLHKIWQEPYLFDSWSLSIGSEDTPAYLQAAMGIAERIQHVGAQ